MADHNINVNFSGDGGGGGNNSGVFKDILTRHANSLNKLQNNFDKLQNNFDKVNTTFNVVNKSLQTNFNKVNTTFSTVGKDLLKNNNSTNKNLSGYLDKINENLKQINNNITGSSIEKKDRQKKEKDNEFNKSIFNTLGASLATAFGVTAMRLINNVANQSMNQAKIIGGFLASGVRGQADQVFGQYVNNMYTNQKNYDQAKNKILAQGIGGGVGSVVGTLLGGLIGKSPNGVTTGAKIGAGVGGVAGDYFASVMNAPIEKRMAIIGAIKQREAEASLLQYRAGFSRFGLPMTSVQLASSGMTGGKPINTSLSMDFEKAYGYKNGMPNPNYNAILSLVPYLKTNPLDKKATGDLNDTVQNFNKAGLAVQDYTKAVIQGNLYQTITNKNLKEYSDTYRKAVVKYGEDYTLGTQQTTLNLMALGFKENEAQRLSFQSQYNQSVMGNVSRYMHQGVGDWYKNKALSDMTGIDINASLKSGTLQGKTTQINQLKKEYNQMMASKTDPMSLPLLSTLWASGTFDLGQLGGLLQPQVKSKIKGIDTGQAGYSPAQEQYVSDIKNILSNGTININDMNVTASVVNIVNQGGSSFGNNAVQSNNSIGALLSTYSPTVFRGDYSPAKK